MRKLVILGGGTGGTIAANRLRSRLAQSSWTITVVDRDDDHVYQPGLLQLPFGAYDAEDLVRPRRRYLTDGVTLVLSDIERVDPDAAQVQLADGELIDYDYLVIATGTSPRPDQTPGLLGDEWQRSIFDFYTLSGAEALRRRLATWDGGRLVVHVAEMPIKCPVAPLEFAFLADAFFAEREMRDAVDITYVTPLDGAFTKPVAARRLAGMLDARGIRLETDFVVDRVDSSRRQLVSMDEREVGYDLLVTVPVNMGADYIARSGLGNEFNYVPVDMHTLRSKAHENIFAIGDANDIPTSKAGSVTHFSIDSFVDNLVDLVHGRPMTRSFDGHANCFVESGRGHAMLIDFNYDTEPLPGKYPLPVIGPFTLLDESHVNHWGKRGFRWAYWNVLLPGRPMPVPTAMSMAGKHQGG